jgi:hypothetical protein
MCNAGFMFDDHLCSFFFPVKTQIIHLPHAPIDPLLRDRFAEPEEGFVSASAGAARWRRPFHQHPLEAWSRRPRPSSVSSDDCWI